MPKFDVASIHGHLEIAKGVHRDTKAKDGKILRRRSGWQRDEAQITKSAFKLAFQKHLDIL